MYEVATTPIGFLPGVIWVRSHIMFTYPRRDEKFISSVVDYLAAGVEQGEFAVFQIERPYIDEVAARLTERCSSMTQDDRPFFAMEAPEESFFAEGVLDLGKLDDFWSDKVLPFCPDMSKVRLFSDSGMLLSNRIARLKLLEFESRMNYMLPVKLAMCAYDINGDRSTLMQARSVHPFIANSRSIRINTEYVPPAQFLSAFYKRKTMVREYTAIHSQSERLMSHLMETAVRTPLTMQEISELCSAVSWAFGHIIERNHLGCNDNKRLYLTIASESDALQVTIKDNSNPKSTEVPDGDAHMFHNHLMNKGLVDDVLMQTWDNTIIITLTKKYTIEHEWSVE